MLIRLTICVRNNRDYNKTGVVDVHLYGNIHIDVNCIVENKRKIHRVYKYNTFLLYFVVL